ncbi:flagellar protein FlaG [Pseudoduganella umbonata]|uniref:Flagellar protein FlaG n=1 Tax=Pseudoduganella umbonata TaxID=864828 RepID=A0A4P8HSA8_9BURK|nr:flagellar protein FlaG [Pseudoduganella umbonata]MBB3225124.1 flagellar protein FlaG [Pseudoduganella umbonata]QCP11410.1 flagellar protein FlaG [Pseudoduganella umbonata]
MTIDPLGLAAIRPGNSFAAQAPPPAASRAPAAAATTATTATATDETPPAATIPGTDGSTDALDDAVSKLNASVHAQSLEFSIDEDSKRTIVKVIDSETKEVVRQLPTKEALEIAKSLDKAFGLLIRQQA